MERLGDFQRGGSKFFKEYTFIRAFQDVSTRPGYDHAMMVQGISRQPSKLVYCTKVENYKDLLRDLSTRVIKIGSSSSKD